ncbi:MAG: cache domain-containing protein, partial [Clostridia bacterium]
MDRKSKRTYQWMIVAFVLVCFAMGFACFQYYRSLQRTVKEENNGYMAEISNQMEINVSKTIEDNFLGLNAMALVLKNREMDVYDQFRAMVLDFQSHWNYQKILLIDESGIAYDEQGNTVALRSDPYLREVIVSKKASMSASQVIDGEECIVFAVPLAGIQMDGKRILALAGAYDLRTFDKILSMTAFDGKGYAHIIREDGTI